MNENEKKNKNLSEIVPFFILLCYLTVLLADLQIEIFMIFFFLKTTRLPLRGFHPSCFPWVPQERFSPRDLFIFLFFLTPFFTPLGRPKRFSTQ